MTLLDGFSLRVGPEPHTVDGLPHGVQRLLAHVCLCGRLPRTAIAGHLWPDVPEPQAHGSLRSALWRLHRSAPGLIKASDGALSLADDVSVDTRDLSDWARRVLGPRPHVEELTVPDVGLRGELLPGWYDDWVLLERERFRQLRMHTLEIVAMRLVSVGRFGEALQTALAAVSAEPLRESAHRTVVRVHLAEGNIAEAVRAYHLYRSMLEKDLGVEPTDQMVGLFRGLSRTSPSSHGRPRMRPPPPNPVGQWRSDPAAAEKVTALVPRHGASTDRPRPEVRR